MRDARQSLEHYQRVAKEYANDIQEELTFPYSSDRLPRDGLTVVSAMYSGGAPVELVRDWLEETVRLQFRIFDQWEYRPEAPLEAVAELEVLAAARLVDAGLCGRLAEARLRCRYSQLSGDEIDSIYRCVAAILNGRPVVPVDRAEARRMTEVNAYFRHLVDWIEAVPETDCDALTAVTRKFFDRGWKTVARGLGRNRSSEDSDYSGEWCFLAAAVFKARGCAPDARLRRSLWFPAELLKPR